MMLAITFADKWRRIEQIDAELKRIDAAWERLVREKNDLLMIRIPDPLTNKHHSNREQAEDRARKISELKSKGLTQRAIAEQLGIKRHAVAYYLRPDCKARARAEAR